MAQILIAGGGIGGLAAALATARGGHEVTVLERRDAFTELGAGIQLAPNAFAALDVLGVGHQVRDRAVHIEALQLMNGTTGARLCTLPVGGAYRRRFGHPYVVVHRNDLYQPLVETCQAVGVRTLASQCVVGYAQDESGVTVELDSGERMRGDVLIGADGIRSAVREQLLGDGEPRVSGHTIYRSLVSMDDVPENLRWNTVTLWAGPLWHFVHYPVNRGRHLNLAAVRDDGARTVVVGRPTERDMVLEGFPTMAATARRLLQIGRKWKSWVLCDRDPAPTWTDGRVTLLGDAAHPMLQYAAQGACMALEDAVILGRLLEEASDFPQRLKEYEVARRDRTGRAQEVSRRMTELYHAQGAAARDRDATLAALSAEALYDRVAWLHGNER